MTASMKETMFTVSPLPVASIGVEQHRNYIIDRAGKGRFWRFPSCDKPSTFGASSRNRREKRAGDCLFLFFGGVHREHKGLPYARLVKYSETGSEEETCKALILLDLLVDDLELLPII